MFEQEDGELNLILPLVLGIAVIVSIATALFAGLTLPRFAKPAAAPAAAVAPAAPAAAAPAAPMLSLHKVYFETGKATVSDADRAVIAGDVAGALKSRPDLKVAITGYTDASGNLEQNLELAKQRAFAVRDALVAAGIAESRLTLQKPETVTGSGDPREARRVELYEAR